MADTMKITFELELADNPPLYQDLVKFPKGTRRVNRLRTLAHAGLMSQLGSPRQPEQDKAPSAPADSIMTEASLELFGPAVDDR
jgi:hypothetical protein